ncbi:hypothetical protein SAMN02745157_1756 [Kaistia soli DSM 19436]|uniref:Lipoprotein n=1 Tax=Kaistia soli DSM 19436 TaxID=1122133 RepID=A0A1M4Z9M5_9HYPH|nr:hypothetical protein [Kaistia soli]SHF14731.1 hypothetical protein SAMN02745157_1756 [Kaistia soli DSM 19436]
MIEKGNWPVRAFVAMTAAMALSACGGGDGVTGAAQSMATAITPTAVAPPAVPLSQAKIAFAPVTGAPATILTNISAQLGKEAFTQQVNLVPSNDPEATYIIKGYLSAVGDASGTILVFVWDVFDRSGRRVHRISGQSMAPGATRDPWSGVDAATTADVARQTINALVDWGRAGPTAAAAPVAAPVAVPVTVAPSIDAIPSTTLPPETAPAAAPIILPAGSG